MFNLLRKGNGVFSAGRRDFAPGVAYAVTGLCFTIIFPNQQSLMLTVDSAVSTSYKLASEPFFGVDSEIGLGDRFAVKY